MFWILLIVFGFCGGLVMVLRGAMATSLARTRLGDDLRLQSPVTNVATTTTATTRQSAIGNPLGRGWRLAPYIVGLVFAILMVTLTSIPDPIGWASGLVVALLLAQLEVGLHQRRVAKVEKQLIDLLDMMIPMLRSGAGAMTALSSATEQIKSPMREQIDWTVRRIQLGDRGTDVFRALANRIPSDAIELFSTTMSVHWETGGSLAPILASVSRVARDRQEVARRIRSNVAQSQFSTVAILILIYFVAAILWFDRPQQVNDFVQSELGGLAVAATVVLQGVGIMWMNAMSRPKS